MALTANIIAGFVIALLSGMGVGSAGLLVVWLTVFYSVPQLTAQGINLFFFLFSCSSALLVHIRKRKLFLRADLFMVLTGIAGAVAGSRISASTDTAVLKNLFALMLIACGIISLRKGAVSLYRKKAAAK